MLNKITNFYPKECQDANIAQQNDNNNMLCIVRIDKDDSLRVEKTGTNGKLVNILTSLCL